MVGRTASREALAPRLRRRNLLLARLATIPLHAAAIRGTTGPAPRLFREAVTVPAYLIVHAERRGDDTLLEDNPLTVEFTPDWVVFTDAAGPCYAVPREQVRNVMRVDEPQEPQDQEPTPQKE